MALLKTIMVRALLLVAAVVMFALDANDAFAQSGNCDSLANTLRQIERSGNFADLGDINDRTRQAQDDVTAAESQYVRDGCNAAAKRGEKLNAQCRAEARAVLSARAALKQVSSEADTGNNAAQQRQAVLQEMARFNCDSRRPAPQQRGGLFDQLFGSVEDTFGGSDSGDGVSTRGDEFSGYQGYDTIRTVCVRKVDGYYWPISYSTLIDYAQNDLLECQAQCPGMDVDLYYYNNPGQEPEQMVNLQGVPYKSLPTAFAYRTNYDPNNTCKPKVDYGSINLASLDDGTSRAMITFDGQTFPLPIRDPRRPTNATVVSVAAADYVDVPLPRPRPAAPGETAKPVVVQQAANDPNRIVMFGDKRVRIVGPDTPYAPTAAAGT
jgi:hypothetical protein